MTRPKGISEYHWRYYLMGYQAYEEGKSRDEAQTIQYRVTRSWWLAGWLDADLDFSNTPLETVIEALTQ